MSSSKDSELRHGCQSTGLLKALMLEGQKTVTANWYTTKCLPEILQEENEGTKDRRGRSHSPECTTSREGKQIGRIAVMYRSVTSRTVAQHIESVTHHSVSAHTIRRRLLQSSLSARRPFLGLP
ncbi:transposable element Tcb1 transposase [Trichonephila clavipes]|nr:transposable element Tcb1 transposase [Trichonephila clavipes]